MKALKRPASNKPKQVAKQKKTGAEKEKTCSEKEKEGDKKEMREVPSNPKKRYLKNYYKKNRFCRIEKQLFSWITTVSIWQRLHKGNTVRNIGCVHWVPEWWHHLRRGRPEVLRGQAATRRTRCRVELEHFSDAWSLANLGAKTGIRPKLCCKELFHCPFFCICNLYQKLLPAECYIQLCRSNYSEKNLRCVYT